MYRLATISSQTHGQTDQTDRQTDRQTLACQ